MSSIPKPEPFMFRTEYSDKAVILKPPVAVPDMDEYLTIDTSRGDRYLTIEEVENMVTYMQYWLMWVKENG